MSILRCLPYFQDSPSIGHMANMISKNKINVIFAVSGKQYLYKDLPDYIDGATVGMLNKNSDNIVQLIEKNYKVCHY